MDQDPGEMLGNARKAFKEKRYVESLENYKLFYDNAIEIDRSYYGVRLSYCLGEWAELGTQYPDALTELIKLKESTLSDFEKNQSRQSFHEYSCICKVLNCDEDTFDQFLVVRETNIDLSHKVFRFVYEYCASNRKWDLCREYLGNGLKQYKRSLETFDHMMEFAAEKEGDLSESIYKDGIAAFKREVLWILDMLAYIDEPDEYNSAISKIETDLKERGHGQLYSEICETSPNKQRQ
ncbi:hypothetical protein [Vibrio palustris]|uniref:Uncharacterized protein n=1 Tax=Vibrio palustris TaxID=1918946 RepID=A0A1R4B5M2_9VIBR|nr:hypothetical protein [Vibrio palustris]SJL84203.1 hypothetical protein VPAL9027_02185 [Vibrio palustris]